MDSGGCDDLRDRQPHAVLGLARRSLTMRPRNVIIHHQNLGGGGESAGSVSQSQLSFSAKLALFVVVDQSPGHPYLAPESENPKSIRTFTNISEDMTSHEQYMLRVTAGPTYDVSKHEPVPVNREKPVSISSDLIDAKVHMRIKDYRGLPEGSPSTSPYFSTPQHPYDRYSISFSFTPKQDIAGDKLVFGNDFDHPIRDRLPPLFDKAFGIVKWWIDPGLDGDVYADEPYLYGALLSSINVFRIGSKKDKQSGDKDPEGEVQTDGDVEKSGSEDEVVVYEEGADGDGATVRKEKGIPDKAGARQKFFLTEQNRKDFTFEAGREYQCDFFNPYLDFNEFSLKIGYGLPNISMIRHWDGQPLRYVLKNRETNHELFVVVIELLPTEQAKKEGVEDAEEKFAEAHSKEGEKEAGKDSKDNELD